VLFPVGHISDPNARLGFVPLDQRLILRGPGQSKFKQLDLLDNSQTYTRLLLALATLLR
jgi:hypothetical protein